MLIILEQRLTETLVSLGEAYILMQPRRLRRQLAKGRYAQSWSIKNS